MARMVVVYRTPADVAAFERHYFTTHVPLTKQLPEACLQERSIYGRNRIRRGQIIINTGPIPKEPSRAERRHRVVKTVRIVAVEVIESSHLADKTPDELAEPLRAVRAGHISGRGSFLPFGAFHLSEDDDASLSHRRPGGSDHGDELVRARDHRAYGRADQ